MKLCMMRKLYLHEDEHSSKPSLCISYFVDHFTRFLHISFCLSYIYVHSYAQAWRLLGFYVDCNDNGNNKKDHRNLNNDNNKNSGCSRYLLWAGYVDLEYEGGGIGEYQFWDADNQAWDTSACEATGSERCAKMDCHEPDTHFQLLGYFKHNGPDDWMEQLFKHEGVCVFGDDAYDFMEGYREFWPQGCTNSGKMSGSDYIYYDIKPLQNGGMTVGLYTDSSCSVEYTGRAVKLSDIYPNIDDLDTFFNTWNSYWDTFKTCLPCVAFQLNGQDHDGHRFLNDGNNFDCDDEAGYQNVNQCMKFATHSDMAAASFEDLLLASTQGTILPSNAAGLHLSKSQLWKHDWLLLTIAATVFVLGLTCYVYALTLPRRRKRSSRDEPLVD